ncbi:MAG: hypothetical protein ABI557_12495, partial [Aureliella sp.]
WENQHLQFAQRLGLSVGPPTHRENSDDDLAAWVGPRYLLPSHDGQWAIHEMVSALEAMDCPIESISYD